MTCIIGIVSKDNAIFMGGDSAVTGHYSISIRPDQKVFTNHGFLIGCAGSARAGNLVKYKFSPPQPVGDDMFEYIVTGFVDSLRDCLKSAGNASKDDEFEFIHATFLVGFFGRLFQIAGDYHVEEVVNGYDAIGAGSDLALGSLYATPKMSPRRRIQTALEASAMFNTSVRAPWQICRVKW